MNILKTLRIGLVIIGALLTNQAFVHGFTQGVAVKDPQANSRPLTAIEKALYKDNPWLFIQKKLIEDPNNKPLSVEQLGLDALILGVAAGAGDCFDCPSLALILGTVIFLITNFSSRELSKANALNSFLHFYAKPGSDNYKQYTPETLHLFFDVLSKIPTKKFFAIARIYGYDEAFADIKRAAEEHSPAFKLDDKLKTKIKWIAAAAIAFMVIKELRKQTRYSY